MPPLDRAAQNPKYNILEAILQSMFSGGSLPTIPIRHGYQLVDVQSAQELSEARTLVRTHAFIRGCRR